MAKRTNVFRKRPTEIESYGIDYTDRLSNEIYTNDTIASSDWSVPTGITESADAIDQSNTRATILLSGGTNGTQYTLTNTVITNSGRTLVEKLIIEVQS